MITWEIILSPLCRPLLDEVTLPDITRCGLNSPSPDSLTPVRVAATIWTWADGHPYNPYSGQNPPAQLWKMLRDMLQSLFVTQDSEVQPFDETCLQCFTSLTPSMQYLAYVNESITWHVHAGSITA